MRAQVRLIAVAAVLAMTGCQAAIAPSPTDPPGSASTTTFPETVTTVGAAEGVGRFRDCLRDRGIDLEPVSLDAQGRPRLDLAMRGVDLSERVVIDALGRCATHLITGALSLEGSPLIREELVSRLVGFADCVRSRGVPGFPDPIPGFYGVGFAFPVEEIPYDDPDLANAVEACRDRMIEQ